MKSILFQRLDPRVSIYLTFILSRLVFFSVGVRFDASRLDRMPQFIDPVLLQTRLWESLYYLHSQPPLFNLFLGIVLQLFPNHYVIAFQVVYLIFGILLTHCMYSLLVRMGVSPAWSSRWTVLYIISPSCILYENLLFYSYMIAVLLVCAAWLFHRYIQAEKPIHGFIFFLMLAIIGLMRSVFHPMWLAFLIVTAIHYQKKKYKEILLLASLPLLLLFALYLKNWHQFGFFGGSSWLGMNFSKITIFQYDEAERNELVKQQVITETSAYKPLSPLEFYVPPFPLPPKQNIPILDQEMKSSGDPNLHHLAYVAISQQYLRDSLRVIRNDPRAYGRGILTAFYLYFMPSSYYPLLHVNRMRIYYYDSFYAAVIYGKWIEKVAPPNPADPFPLGYYIRVMLFLGIGIIAAYLLIFVYFLKTFSYHLRPPTDKAATSAVLLFILANLIYVTLTVNLIECGENQRFRFMVEPITWILIGVIIQQILIYRQKCEKERNDCFIDTLLV